MTIPALTLLDHAFFERSDGLRMVSTSLEIIQSWRGRAIYVLDHPAGEFAQLIGKVFAIPKFFKSITKWGKAIVQQSPDLTYFRKVQEIFLTSLKMLKDVTGLLLSLKNVGFSCLFSFAEDLSKGKSLFSTCYATASLLDNGHYYFFCRHTLTAHDRQREDWKRFLSTIQHSSYLTLALGSVQKYWKVFGSAPLPKEVKWLAVLTGGIAAMTKDYYNLR